MCFYGIVFRYMAFPDKKNTSSEFPPGIITWDAIKPLIARNRFLPEAELRQQLYLGSGVQRSLREMNYELQQLSSSDSELGEVYRLIRNNFYNDIQLVQSKTRSDYCFPGNSTYFIQKTSFSDQVGSLSVSNLSGDLKAVQVLQFLHFNEGVRIIQTRDKLIVLLRTVGTQYTTNLSDAEVLVNSAWYPLNIDNLTNELFNNGYAGNSFIMASDVDHRFLAQLHIAAYSGGKFDQVLNRIA